MQEDALLESVLGVFRLVGCSAGGEGAGGVCLVYPLMACSLEDRLFPEGAAAAAPLTWTERLQACVSTARALLYLHTPDPAVHKPVVLHRDLKPPNILMDADGHIRLADVGLAKMHRSDVVHLTLRDVMGTNGFIDPSYMRDGHYDTAADAYSLGVTVLILLTGWPAFGAGQSVYNRCKGCDVSAVADRKAQWPTDKAKEVLQVGMGLANPDRRGRTSVSNALAALEALLDRPAPARAIIRECLFCMAAPRAVRLPCGHSAYCKRCWKEAVARPGLRCPYCNCEISKQGAVESDGIGLENTFVMPAR
mmetsp:Transcript_29613/g.59818  ORF Transcript_29613/g.59818 Transcript_29613/m.59818 type:complete len:307 (-) Transcript_29613:154-1074(-)